MTDSSQYAAQPDAQREKALGDALEQLPSYGRSLLKIQVPVSVTLANKSQSVAKILEMSPGTIIQFDKACDDTVRLEVGGCEIAEGEAVKVGDKFGLRITAITLPPERFKAITGQSATSR